MGRAQLVGLVCVVAVLVAIIWWGRVVSHRNRQREARWAQARVVRDALEWTQEGIGFWRARVRETGEIYARIAFRPEKWGSVPWWAQYHADVLGTMASHTWAAAAGDLQDIKRWVFEEYHKGRKAEKSGAHWVRGEYQGIDEEDTDWPLWSRIRFESLTLSIVDEDCSVPLEWDGTALYTLWYQDSADRYYSWHARVPATGETYAKIRYCPRAGSPPSRWFQAEIYGPTATQFPQGEVGEFCRLWSDTQGGEGLGFFRVP